MRASKIIINGKELEFEMGISEEEIERNENSLFDTIDLNDVIKEANEGKSN